MTGAKREESFSVVANVTFTSKHTKGEKEHLL